MSIPVPPAGTLSALDGDHVITFTDYVAEGQIVDVYRTYEDAEEERGHFEKRLVCRDGDDWWLENAPENSHE